MSGVPVLWGLCPEVSEGCGPGFSQQLPCPGHSAAGGRVRARHQPLPCLCSGTDWLSIFLLIPFLARAGAKEFLPVALTTIPHTKQAIAVLV